METTNVAHKISSFIGSVEYSPTDTILFSMEMNIVIVQSPTVTPPPSLYLI